MAAGRKPAIAGSAAVAPAKSKSAKPASKAKKPSDRAHPPYAEMIIEAIVALKDRTGSSQIAIAKFIEEKQKASNLSPNFKKLLLVQLKKLVAEEKLVKVKNSFKLAKKDAPAAAPAKKKATAVVAKAEAPVKVKKVAAVAKPAAKPKKVSKTAAVVSPGKKKVAAKVKKAAPVKKVAKKPKSIKSPVKKAATAKGKGRK